MLCLIWDILLACALIILGNVLCQLLKVYLLKVVFTNKLSFNIEKFWLILFDNRIKQIFRFLYTKKFDILLRVEWIKWASTFLDSKLIWEVIETETEAFSIALRVVELFLQFRIELTYTRHSLTFWIHQYASYYQYHWLHFIYLFI